MQTRTCVNKEIKNIRSQYYCSKRSQRATKKTGTPVAFQCTQDKSLQAQALIKQVLKKMEEVKNVNMLATLEERTSARIPLKVT